MPLTLLAVAVLGSVLTSKRAQEEVLDFAREQLPGLEEQIADELRLLVETHQWTGWLGLLGLLWASGHVFFNLELALNLAWQVPRHRTLLQRRALALAMTLLAGVPLVLSILITLAITALRRITVPVLGVDLDAIPAIWTVLGELAPVLLTIGSFTAVYRWVPNCPVRWRPALSGGIIAGLLWEIAKRFVAYYTTHLSRLGQIYGPFTGVVGLMLWMFYSAAIVLLGAEIAAVAQSIHPVTHDPESPEADERLREADSSGV
jgi:YihY family inner membrane protein